MYDARNAEAAGAFVAELDLAVARIEEAPRSWPHHLAATRRYLLRRFPFFVVFREVDDRVQILAVAHAPTARVLAWSVAGQRSISNPGIQPSACGQNRSGLTASCIAATKRIAFTL